MKRTLLLAGVFAASIAVNSQVTRMVLTEEFSNASCGPCASQNPQYNALVAANPTTVIALKYQTSWPGVDPMNAQTQSDVGPRVTYYTVSGVPYGRIDGTEIVNDCGYYDGAPYCLSQADVDARAAVTSPFSITVNPTLNGTYDSVTVDVIVSTPAIFSGTTMKLQVALVEKLVTFTTAPGTNGETVFHNVIRKDMNNANMAGFTIPNSWGAAESHTYTFTIAIPNFIYKHSEMAVVAFVQDNSSKEVHQAEIADVTSVPADYGVTQNITGQPLNCAADVSGITVKLKNTGTTTITSATVNYSVDGGATSTVPYTGSLALAASATINIPTLLSLAGGSHTLTTWVTDVNGPNPGGQMGLWSKNFTVFTSASATPLTQNFSSALFPYANWSLDNPDPAETWAHATPNGGCMIFDNYDYNSGSNSSFIVEPVDMSTLTNPMLTFDVAYRQYAAENDRLQVYVSTNCGTTWSAALYNEAGTVLANGVTPSTTPYTTPAAGDWHNESVDLSAYGSSTQLFIKFKATSAYGNNLFVDNINIATSTAGIEVSNVNSFNVYPNPATDFVNITFTNAENVTISLINTVGQTVKVVNNVNTNTMLSLEGLANGVYILNADINGQRVTKQLIKN